MNTNQDSTRKPSPEPQSALPSVCSDGLADHRVCENDFMFLDNALRPYRVRKIGDELWLHFWSKSQSWVTLRKTSEDEALGFMERALPHHHAKLYEAGVPLLVS